MRRLLSWILSCFVAAGLWAAEPITVELTDGTSITGEPLQPTEEGVKFKLSDGKYTDKVPWGKFNQPTLKQLIRNQKMAAFVEPFIELTASERAKKESITLREVARVERPPQKAGFGALFGSPITLVLFGLIYAGNLYAAFEIAKFRRQPKPLVIGVGAVAPVIGPAIFLSIPTRLDLPQETVEEVAEVPAEGQEQYVEETPVVEEVVVEEPTGPVYPPPTIFQKGQFTFNRRFFETKFVGFMKLVPEDPDMVIDLKSLRGDYVGTRLSKVEPSQLSLQVEKDGASADVDIPFIEITQIAIRHKDAPLE